MTAEYIAKGMEMIQTGKQKEDDDDLESAVTLYNDGVQYLVTGLKYEKDENTANNLKQIVEQYLKRVQAIKAAIQEQIEEQKDQQINEVNKEAAADAEADDNKDDE